MDASHLQQTWRALRPCVRPDARDGGSVSPAAGKNHPLSVRRRGKNGNQCIRGSVALSDKRIHVKEFSTGTSDADAASHLIADYETRLRHQLIFGASGVVTQGPIADVFDSYLSKAQPPCPSDILRIGKLNERIGQLSLRKPKQAWEKFRQAYLMEHAPAGKDRYRASLAGHEADPPPGGNPLKTQRKTVCHGAGINDFTIDDWRHDRASHCVIAGVDLIAVMHMGG